LAECNFSIVFFCLKDIDKKMVVQVRDIDMKKGGGVQVREQGHQLDLKDKQLTLLKFFLSSL
jgi:hypothetical protein